ncbi:MAG: hypothetical protein HY921_03445 [Elusimicrobia bacterium]|nr:hypothetical protein [Elusimicrobiota bacterium]
MAGHFKKRRGPQGPNKNQEKVLRARNAENPARLVGLLGSKFPSVKQMRIHLTFMDARQHILEERDLSLAPSDAAIFTVPCPGRCGHGTFNFALKAAETIAAQFPLSESGAKCPEALYASSVETCGCEIKCRMEIEYFPVAGPVPNA